MKKKLTAIFLCVALAAIAIVGASLAYFTDTDSATNTFTVGKVAITLDEAKVDVDGNLVANADPVKGNAYKLVPSHEYTKDPTVHFKAESEASYLFVKVENGISAIEAADNNTIADQIKANGWTALDGVANVYYKQVDANTGADAIDYPVFGSFKIADNANTAAYGTAQIVVTAYAIQADGMTSATDAWTKLAA